jgi:glucokinase
MTYLGIDVGGQTIKSAFVDATGLATSIDRTPTPPPGSPTSEYSATLAGIIQTYTDRAAAESITIDGVGIVLPGLIDPEAGIALRSGTLGWADYPVLADLTQSTTLPLFLEHDVTAGGLAELRFGAARGVDNAVVIQIGTGLSCALIINGRVHHPHPAVGELGHTPSLVNRPCVCGKSGCLEMTASGGALARNYEALTGDTITAEQVFDKAQAGETHASALWEECLDALAHALHWLASLLGPDVVVFSGGFAFAGEALTAGLEKRLHDRLSIQRVPELRLSTLGGLSGCVGAAQVAREKHQGHK